jgi:hypothetical protein
MNRWTLPALILLMAAPLACSDSDTPGPPKVDEPTLEELLAAPTVLELGSQRLHLETRLFLDRMPSIPPSLSGVSGWARVWEEQEQPLPAGLNPTRVWLIADQYMWHGEGLRVFEPQAPYELRRWFFSDRGVADDVLVQVVVELSLEDVKYLVRAPDNPVLITN